jgi:DNA-directed RNA polymerase specialized sigma24 family protein
MRLPPEEVLRLYDTHAPQLFAVALRVHGDDRTAAAATLAEVFADPPSTELRELVRAVRNRALATRQGQTPRPSVVEGGEPTPRQLVEEAFYRGASVTELARTYQLPESAVRSSLKDGMAALRQQFASGSTKVQQ